MNAAFAKPEELGKQHRAYRAALARDPRAKGQRLTDADLALVGGLLAFWRRSPDEVS